MRHSEFAPSRGKYLLHRAPCVDMLWGGGWFATNGRHNPKNASQRCAHTSTPGRGHAQIHRCAPRHIEAQRGVARRARMRGGGQREEEVALKDDEKQEAAQRRPGSGPRAAGKVAAKRRLEADSEGGRTAARKWPNGGPRVAGKLFRTNAKPRCRRNPNADLSQEASRWPQQGRSRTCP